MPRTRKKKLPLDPNLAMRLYGSGETFLTAAGFLQLQSKKTPYEHLMLPGATFAAFAFELFLKCLLAIEGRSVGGHDLYDLFAALSPDSQRDIRARYESLMETPEVKTDNAAKKQFLESINQANLYTTDFDLLLRLSKDAFVQLRYIHEGKEGTYWAASYILQATKERIMDLQNLPRA